MIHVRTPRPQGKPAPRLARFANQVLQAGLAKAAPAPGQRPRSLGRWALACLAAAAAVGPAWSAPVIYSDLLVWTEADNVQRTLLLDETNNNQLAPLLFARVANTNVTRDTVLNFRQNNPSVDADPSGFSDSLIMKVVGNTLEFYVWSDGKSPPNLDYAQNLAALNIDPTTARFLPVQDEANWGNLASVADVLFQGVTPPMTRIAFASDFNGSGQAGGGGLAGGGGGGPAFKASDTFALRTNTIVCASSFTDAPGASESNTNVCASTGMAGTNPFANGMAIFTTAAQGPLSSKAFGILEPPAHPSDPPDPNGVPADIVAMQVLGAGCDLLICTSVVNWGVWSEDDNTTALQFLAQMGMGLGQLTILTGDETLHAPFNFFPPGGAVAPFDTIQFDSDPVPEPASLLLVLTALALMQALRLRRAAGA